MSEFRSVSCLATKWHTRCTSSWLVVGQSVSLDLISWVLNVGRAFIRVSSHVDIDA